MSNDAIFKREHQMSDEPKPTREECEAIGKTLYSTHEAHDEIRRLARAYLVQMDEIEALRKDKERLEERIDALESEMNPHDVCDVDARLRREREAIDAAKERK